MAVQPKCIVYYGHMPRRDYSNHVHIAQKQQQHSFR